MCTHTRARGGCKGGLQPPPATTPPIDKVDLALQLAAYIHCELFAMRPLPAGWLREESRRRARARVCTHSFVIFFNCIKCVSKR